MVLFTDILRSVFCSWDIVGNVAPGVSVGAHVAHPVGVLQVGSEDSSEESISGCDVIAMGDHRTRFL